MKPHIRLIACLVALAPALYSATLRAQAIPTANRAIRLSAFAGPNATFTGLGSGRNLGITAGADLSIRPFFSLEPSLEVRGTYPVHAGAVDAQRNVLGGLKLAKHFGPLHPYADFLAGRGQIDYQNGGYPDPTGYLRYFTTVSGVFAPGAGADFDLGPTFSLKVDASFPRYSTPVTTSGHVTATALTFALVYHLNFGRFPRRRR